MGTGCLLFLFANFPVHNYTLVRKKSSILWCHINNHPGVA